MQASGIGALKRPEDYREQGRQHIFPSKGSLDWFLRERKAQLVERAALLRVGGRWFVHEARMDAVITGEPSLRDGTTR